MNKYALGSRWELQDSSLIVKSDIDFKNRRGVLSKLQLEALEPNISFKIGFNAKPQKIAQKTGAEGLGYKDLKELIFEKKEDFGSSVKYSNKIGIQETDKEIYWGHFDKNEKNKAKRHGEGLIYIKKSGTIQHAHYDQGEFKLGSRLTSLLKSGDVLSRLISDDKEQYLYKYIKDQDLTFCGEKTDHKDYKGVSRSKGQVFQGTHKTRALYPSEGSLTTITGIEEKGALHGKDLTLDGVASKTFIDGTQVSGTWENGAPIKGKKYEIKLASEEIFNDVLWDGKDFIFGDQELTISSGEKDGETILNAIASRHFDGGLKVTGKWKNGLPIPGEKYQLKYPNESKKEGVLWDGSSFNYGEEKFHINLTASCKGKFKLDAYDSSKSRFNQAFQDAQIIPTGKVIFKNKSKETVLIFDDKGVLRKISSDSYPAKCTQQVNEELAENSSIHDVRKEGLYSLTNKINSRLLELKQEYDGSKELAKMTRKQYAKQTVGCASAVTLGLLVIASIIGFKTEENKVINKVIQKPYEVSSQEMLDNVSNPREKEYIQTVINFRKIIGEKSLNSGTFNANISKVGLDYLLCSEKMRRIYANSNLNQAELKTVIDKIALLLVAATEEHDPNLEKLFASLIASKSEVVDVYNQLLKFTFANLPTFINKYAELKGFELNGQKIYIMQNKAESDSGSSKAPMYNYLLNSSEVAKLKDEIPASHLKSLNIAMKKYADVVKSKDGKSVYKMYLDLYKGIALVADEKYAKINLNLIKLWNNFTARLWYSKSLDSSYWKLLNVSTVKKNSVLGSVIFLIPKQYLNAARQEIRDNNNVITLSKERQEIIVGTAVKMFEEAMKAAEGKVADTKALINTYKQSLSFNMLEQKLYAKCLEEYIRAYGKGKVGLFFIKNETNNTNVAATAPKDKAIKIKFLKMFLD